MSFSKKIVVKGYRQLTSSGSTKSLFSAVKMLNNKVSISKERCLYTYEAIWSISCLTSITLVSVMFCLLVSTTLFNIVNGTTDIQESLHMRDINDEDSDFVPIRVYWNAHSIFIFLILFFVSHENFPNPWANHVKTVLSKPGFNLPFREQQVKKIACFLFLH